MTLKVRSGKQTRGALGHLEDLALPCPRDRWTLALWHSTLQCVPMNSWQSHTTRSGE